MISDGRFNKNNVKPFLREAKEKNYLYIFVILDSTNPVQIHAIGKGEVSSPPKKTGAKGGNGDGSIMSLKNAEKDPETGSIKLVPYLKDFPFEYYCIVRDV